MSAGYTDEEFNDLMDAGVYDHDVDAARGDEQRDALNLVSELPAEIKARTVDLAASIEKLTETGLRIKRQRDDLLAAMKDIRLGAVMNIPYFEGAAQGYMKEVKRVADAAIAEASL